MWGTAVSTQAIPIKMAQNTLVISKRTVGDKKSLVFLRLLQTYLVHEFVCKQQIKQLGAILL